MWSRCRKALNSENKRSPPAHVPQTLTSSDLTHGGDGGVVWRDAAEGLGLHGGVAGDA